MQLDKLIEIWSVQLDQWYEIHVDATEQRYIMEVFAEDTKEIDDETFKKLEELVNQINH